MSEQIKQWLHLTCFLLIPVGETRLALEVYFEIHRFQPPSAQVQQPLCLKTKPVGTGFYSEIIYKNLLTKTMGKKETVFIHSLLVNLNININQCFSGCWERIQFMLIPYMCNFLALKCASFTRSVMSGVHLKCVLIGRWNFPFENKIQVWEGGWRSIRFIPLTYLYGILCIHC